MEREGIERFEFLPAGGGYRLRCGLKTGRRIDVAGRTKQEVIDRAAALFAGPAVRRSE